MDKVKINMIGGCFQHDVCSSSGSIPKYIIWDKTGSSNISMHIDYGIQTITNKSTKNYAWIAESSTINTTLISWIYENIPYLENNFELIFTHDKRLLTLSNKMKLIKCCPKTWISEPMIYDKNKLVSMIASTKIMCDEHNYRQVISEKFKNEIDLFGYGRNNIDKKEYGLNDYCFSITIENGIYPDMFSEKITDCFATGTIPIYWGTPSIGEFFNENGIIKLTDDFKIEDLSFDLYYSKMDYIKENFDIIKNMETTEDYIFNTYIK